MSLPVSAFDFDLPEDLIAQQARPRGDSRLLIVNRASGTWEEATVRDLPRVLRAGDLMIANDTKVFPARLIGRRDPSGGAVECLLLERASADEWDALVHPGQKLKPGARVLIEDAVRAPGVRLVGEMVARHHFGRRTIRFTVEGASDVDEAVDQLGHVPLPPYIHRTDTLEDRERYQTVWARHRGSVAAPTAGLHFDTALIDALDGAGIGWATVTLHVGYGTFKPVRVDTVEDHRVDAERFAMSDETVRRMRAARAAGGRLVAVGTTTTRALESAAGPDGLPVAGTGSTDLFIHPGHQFRVVDALVTNFHLPKSSLLMLVGAFAGVDLTMAAYRYAVERRFRFYSYGDAMLVV